ncbi:MAG: glycosyltransferase family A protein [Chthoniobacteraceae bacterium]
MNTLHPLVSICVPVYNAEPFLEETLKSALAQSYQNWELVIVENQSKDRSREIIERFVERAADPRIRVHINEIHLGSGALNMNHAIGLARGEFIKILCADDTIEPDCLAVQVQSLIDNPGAVMATCCKKIINAKGKLLFRRQGFNRSGFIKGGDVIKGCFRVGTNLIGEPTLVLLRVSSLEGIELMNPARPYVVDLDLWLRLMLRGGIVYDRRALGSFRVHGHADTRKLESRMLGDFFDMADDISRQAGTTINAWQYRWLKFRIPIQNAVRRLVYRWSSGWK